MILTTYAILGKAHNCGTSWVVSGCQEFQGEGGKDRQNTRFLEALKMLSMFCYFDFNNLISFLKIKHQTFLTKRLHSLWVVSSSSKGLNISFCPTYLDLESEQTCQGQVFRYLGLVCFSLAPNRIVHTLRMAFCIYETPRCLFRTRHWWGAPASSACM